MSQSQFRGLHILLVDSDAHTRDRVQQALGPDSILRYARSLEEACLLLEEALPDLLICEAVLTQESGLDLCRLVRCSPAWQHLPIMLLTSLSTLQDKVAAFEAGADDFVVKPFDARHLLARIRLLARIKHLEFNR